MKYKQPLLSICVPTYNRAIYLDRLLTTLLPQVKFFDDLIQVCILDNASEDDTKAICEKHLKQGYNFSYFCQDSNTGMDGNFKASYLQANGRFVWLLGDDEYLRYDAISNILVLLSKYHNVDLIYINSEPVSTFDVEEKNVDNDLQYDVYNSKDEFSKKMGVLFTFISGLIINKQNTSISEDFIDLYKNTSLSQLSWVFSALKNGSEFIFVNNKYIYAQQDNTGGYRLFAVFARNLSQITFDFFGDTQIAKNIRLSAMKFLLGYVHKKRTNFFNEDVLSVLNFSFGHMLIYRAFYKWLFCYPQLYVFLKKLKSIF